MTDEHGNKIPLYHGDDVEARERILMARIAELEADAKRYRWLTASKITPTYDGINDITFFSFNAIFPGCFKDFHSGVDAAIAAEAEK